ncbi:2-amino-4-hydroxy-6-hydroxymethyldihydropteridine diphosphokinase [Gorillibacterium timonense]|uniref:2-amino-4-hydroxy-6- hydroxymethyldihydropteridine diphosphokinase n=1 Tax=Gorillibacterium timonense TaxID=1689269 RepID=UPI00071CD4B5|nr:2-amino-4-hydroxy-6-hydroxymethyldihydropteridine diphosphokinase [Gorillibacterium timonense]
MDKMTLNRMEFFAYHGVYAEENKLGQHYYVDLELLLPLSRAGFGDELTETINYAELYARVRTIVVERTFRLIEALAEHIAQDLLGFYPELQEVLVRVTKPHPPFEIHFAGVSVEIRRSRPVEVYVGLGSNLGERHELLAEAIRLLSEHPRIKLLRQSRLYETEPVGFVEQGKFLNQAAAFATDLPPEELLVELQRVENRLGRVRDKRWGPRTVDLDLLLYGQVELRLPRLTVPHPRLAERAFVLVPLAEIATDDAVPGLSSLSARIEAMPARNEVVPWTR